MLLRPLLDGIADVIVDKKSHKRSPFDEDMFLVFINRRAIGVKCEYFNGDIRQLGNWNVNQVGGGSCRDITVTCAVFVAIAHDGKVASDAEPVMISVSRIIVADPTESIFCTINQFAVSVTYARNAVHDAVRQRRYNRFDIMIEVVRWRFFGSRAGKIVGDRDFVAVDYPGIALARARKCVDGRKIFGCGYDVDKQILGQIHGGRVFTTLGDFNFGRGCGKNTPDLTSQGNIYEWRDRWIRRRLFCRELW